MDNIDRKVMDAQNSAQQEKFKEAATMRNLDKVIETIPDGIVTVDINGRFTFANAAAEKILGVERSKIIGRAYDDPPWKITAIDDKPLPSEKLPVARVFDTGRPIYNIELEIEHLNGKKIAISVNVAPLCDEQGNLTGAVLSFTDITRQKKVEAALRASEKMYRSLIDNAGDAIFTIDLEGNFIGANKAAEELTGYTKDELLKMRFPQLCPKSQVERIIAGFKQAVKVGSWSLTDISILRKDGKTIPVDLTGKLIELDGKKIAEAIVRDVSACRRVEESLKENEARFRKVFDEGPIGMAITGHDFKFLRVNPRLCEMTGYTEEELTKMTFADITYPEDIDTDVQLARKLFKGEVPFFNIEKRYVKKSGEIFWISLSASLIRDEQGNPLYGLGMIEDISERKKAEEALRSSEAKYRMLVEQIPAVTYIASIDGSNTTLYISPKIESLLGYEPNEFIENPDFWANRIHPDDRERVVAKVGRAHANCTPLAIEYRMIASNGRVVWFRDEALLVRDESGKPLFYQGIMTDITDRKRIEEALRESEERYRTLFEAATDAIFILDIGGERPGRIVAANQAAADMHGMTIDEILKMHITDLDTPETARHSRERVERILAGETIRFEGEHRRKDGTVFPVEVHASLVEFGGRKYIQAFDRDITESKRAKELSDALNYINEAINSTLDFDEVMRRVVIESTQAIGSEAAAIIMHEGDRWVAKYVFGFPPSIIGMRFTDNEARALVLAAKTRRLVAANDAQHDARVNGEEMEKYGIRSLLSIPLIVKNEVIGVLSFYYRSKSVVFSEIQIDFATKLATSISLALENVRLYEAQHKIADTLQESLLIMPEHIEGVSFGYLYRSATEAAKVGGDFYDIFEIEHGKIGIIIGDVSGKGIEATALTSLVKNTIKAHAYEDRLPALVIAKTNDLVVKSSPPSVFVTVVFSILDTDTGKLTYCNAGHPPAIIKRRSGKVELLDKHSPIIGAFPKLHYRSGKVTLESGDILLLYTDGLIEARCNGGFYGEKRLVEFVQGLKSVQAGELPQKIFDKAMECTGSKLSDDVAILAVSI
ncbi:MAG: PAS domain S-box protein [Firmicutes bacterium]|nr:PAS domain S-box protein [Bacillota bacterium]